MEKLPGPPGTAGNTDPPGRESISGVTNVGIPVWAMEGKGSSCPFLTVLPWKAMGCFIMPGRNCEASSCGDGGMSQLWWSADDGKNWRYIADI